MKDRTYALISALFVLTLGAAIGVVAYWLSGTDVGQVAYTVVAREDISGLHESSQVFYRGVPAGRVEAIRFDPKNVREILIEVSLDPQISVTHGTYATLRPQGITGLAQLALHDESKDPEPLPAGTGRIPLKPGLLEKLSGSAEATMANLNELTARLNALLDDKNRARIAGSLAHLEAVLAGLDEMREDLHAALAAIPEFTADACLTLGQINKLLTHADALASRGEALTESLRQAVDEGKRLGSDIHAATLPRLDRMLTELTEAGQEVRHLVHSLRDNPQSLLVGRSPHTPGPGEVGYRKVRP